MNNRQQKNVIYGLTSKNVLPYKLKQDVQTKSENFRSNTINNIFNQLVDNDRFIENKIVAGGKNIDGPKKYGDDEIEGLENGSKILMDSASSEQIQIFRKQNKTIQESLQKVLGGKVNSICKYESYLLVGTDDGLFYTTDGNQFQTVVDSGGEGVQGSVTVIKSYPNAVFFSCDGDIYIITGQVSGNQIRKVNQNSVGGTVNDLYYLPYARTLYVSTDSGLFKAMIRNFQEFPARGLNFSLVSQFGRDGILDQFENFSISPIGDENQATEQDLVVGTSEGLLVYKEDENGLANCSKILDDELCYFVDAVGYESIVVGTINGIKDNYGNQVIRTEMPIAAYCEIGSKRYYYSDSKIIEAEYQIDDNGDVHVETEEFKFKHSSGDYALGMFMMDIKNDDNQIEKLIFIHTKLGMILTFLPSVGLFVVVDNSGLERAQINVPRKTIDAFDGQYMQRIDIQSVKMDYSDVVQSVQKVIPVSTGYARTEIDLGEVLKIIPDDSTGGAVVLTKSAAWSLSANGIAQMMYGLSSLDYVAISKLTYPIVYQYSPISNVNVTPQEWEQISDDTFFMDYNYVAVRSGKNKVFYVDLLTSPKLSEHESPVEDDHGSIKEYSSVTLSSKFHSDYQYPIDVKQDEDHIIVLATEGLFYIDNQDIVSLINEQLSTAIVGKNFKVETPNDQFQRYSSHVGDSSDRIAKTDGNVYMLSSGSMFRIGTQKIYVRDTISENVDIWKDSYLIYPVRDLSQFYILDSSRLNLSVVQLTSTDDDGHFSVSEIYQSTNELKNFINMGYYGGDYLSVYGMNAGLCVNVKASPPTVQEVNTYWSDILQGTLIQSVSTYTDPETEDEVDYVSSAIHYTVQGYLGSRLMCQIISNLYLLSDSYEDNRFYDVEHFDFLDDQKPPITSLTQNVIVSEITGVSSLDSFQFPNGFVREGNDIKYVKFLLGGQIDQYECGTMEQFQGRKVEILNENAVIVSSDLGRILYNLQFDEDGNPYAEESEVIEYTNDLQGIRIKDVVYPIQFETVKYDPSTDPSAPPESKLQTINMFNSFFGKDINIYDSVFVGDDANRSLITLGPSMFKWSYVGLSGLQGMIDDEDQIYVLSSSETSATVFKYVGIGETSLCAQFDQVPKDFFRDRKGIYAILGNTLVRRGSDGYDYDILDTGDEAERINHVQTAAGRTFVATEDGLMSPIFVRAQSIQTRREDGTMINLSSVSRIIQDKDGGLSVLGDEKQTSGYKTIYEYDSSTMEFVPTSCFGIDKFHDIIEVRGTDRKMFSSPGGQLSTQDQDGNLVEYPFGGNAMSVIGSDEIYGRTYVCTIDGLYYADGFGKQASFARGDFEGDDFSKFGRFLHCDDGSILVPTEEGLYKADRMDGEMEFFKSTYSIEGDVACVAKAGDGYIAGNGTDLSKSDGYLQFSKLLSTQSNVTDAYFRNQNEYYVGTENGLYKTSYGYKLVNDTYVYSEDELYEIFMEYFESLQEELSADISEHVEQNHAENSIITKVDSELAGIDFDGVKLKDWNSDRVDGLTHVINNDVVYEVEFGSNQSGEVHIQMHNFLTSDSNPRFSYIRKHWYSGINELYIYLPTTNTYYISHVNGSSGCQVTEDDSFFRKNLIAFGEETGTIKSTIQEHATTISVTIPDTMAQYMDEILDVQINGNSLPLKIYKDEQFEFREGDAARMYHSSILPSEVVYVPTGVEDKDQDGQYRFVFACFGQDAQAIKIMYYDSDSHIDENNYLIRFNANGAHGTMQDQMFRIAENKAKHLRKCQFYWNNGVKKVFAGWSFSPTSTAAVIMDGDLFDWRNYPDYMEQPAVGSVVTLFATWFEYNDDDGYTEILMDFGDENESSDDD